MAFLSLLLEEDIRVWYLLIPGDLSSIEDRLQQLELPDDLPGRPYTAEPAHHAYYGMPRRPHSSAASTV